ncbi:MAG: hypothetical protein ABI977_05705 [Acidobacteriota bacterium]
MKLLFGLFAILIGISTHGLAQDQSKCLDVTAVVRSKKVPTVYVTFERTVDPDQSQARLVKSTDVQSGNTEGKIEKVGDAPPNIMLRIHNNTNWAVKLPTESLYLSPKFVIPLRFCDGRGMMGLRDGIEIKALYKVELVNGNPAATPGFPTDVSSNAWLPPGQSVLFQVPRQSLMKGSVICLLFNYEWEGNGNEPQHRVYFYWHQLPKELQ